VSSPTRPRARYTKDKKKDEGICKMKRLICFSSEREKKRARPWKGQNSLLIAFFFLFFFSRCLFCAKTNNQWEKENDGTWANPRLVTRKMIMINIFLSINNARKKGWLFARFAVFCISLFHAIRRRSYCIFRSHFFLYL
jgi:hypothetical protein